MSSLRDTIIQSDDIQTETVDVPEWGVSVEVRGMSGAERARMLEAATNPQTDKIDFAAIYPEVIIATACDPSNGEKVFSISDRDILNTKSAAALERVAKVGMRLSGIGDDAEKESGKESPSTPNDASTTT